MTNKFKTGTVTKTIEKQITVTEEVEVQQYDWDLIPSGTYVECNIKDKPTKGVYVNENEYRYILHNDGALDGNKPKQNYGYSYGWIFNSSDANNGKSDVTNIEFPEPPSDFKLIEVPQIEVAGYTAKICADRIEVGCQTVSRETIEQVLIAMNQVKNNGSESTVV